MGTGFEKSVRVDGRVDVMLTWREWHQDEITMAQKKVQDAVDDAISDWEERRSLNFEGLDGNYILLDNVNDILESMGKYWRTVEVLSKILF